MLGTERKRTGEGDRCNEWQATSPLSSNFFLSVWHSTTMTLVFYHPFYVWLSVPQWLLFSLSLALFLSIYLLLSLSFSLSLTLAWQSTIWFPVRFLNWFYFFFMFNIFVFFYAKYYITQPEVLLAYQYQLSTMLLW